MIDLSNNNLTGIFHIDDIDPDIEELDLSHNNLIGKHLYSNSLSMLQTIRFNDNISVHSISDNIIQSLLSLPNLVNIYLANTLIDDVLVIRKSSRLEILDVSNTGLMGSVVGLHHLSKLRVLNIRNNYITSLSSVSTLTNLQYLDVSFNNIITLPNISNLNKLSLLDVSNTEIVVDRDEIYESLKMLITIYT